MTNPSRKKVGIALGSGSWRGLAHIGVLKVLESHGIQVDYITGASVGALVGGLYSYYGNTSELEKIVAGLSYKELLSALSDPSANLGLLKGDKLLNFLNKYLHGAKIEDLKIPFKAAATDILSGEAIYLDRGSLAEAIRASVSIPLVLRPVEIDGRKLVDGGISTPIPTEELRNMGAEIVIGVNLYGNIFPMEGATNGVVKLSTKEIGRLSYQMLLSQLARKNLEHADISITPLIREGSFSLFKNFVKEKGTVVSGENAMESRMDELLGLLEG